MKKLWLAAVLIFSVVLSSGFIPTEKPLFEPIDIQRIEVPAGATVMITGCNQKHKIPMVPIEEILDYTQVEMLACVIYQEAGSDICTNECRMMVADVVLNRVEDERFPDTIEGVLTAPGQYSLYSTTGVVWPERAFNPGEAKAVDRAYRIAENALSGLGTGIRHNGYVWQAEFEQGEEIVECCGLYFGK